MTRRPGAHAGQQTQRQAQAHANAHAQTQAQQQTHAAAQLDAAVSLEPPAARGRRRLPPEHLPGTSRRAHTDRTLAEVSQETTLKLNGPQATKGSTAEADRCPNPN